MNRMTLKLRRKVSGRLRTSTLMTMVHEHAYAKTVGETHAMQRSMQRSMMAMTHMKENDWERDMLHAPT